MKKICATCGINKESTNFYRDARKSDGLRNTCKQCSIQNTSYKTNIDSIQSKTCNRCKQNKSLEFFIKDERRTLGYGTYCLDCAKQKLCRTCQKKKSLDRFNTSNRSGDGFRYSCKDCDNEKNRERYAASSARRKRISDQNAKYRYKKNTQEGRRERLLAKYGLTIESYNNMLELQNSSCKICDCKEGERGRSVLAVDHNHNTGEVRGLLCDPCNRALGMFLDSPEILLNAVEYLRASERV